METYKNTDKIILHGGCTEQEIAKWCGANLFNNEYIDFLSAKDMIAERFKVKGGVEE